METSPAAERLQFAPALRPDTRPIHQTPVRLGTEFLQVWFQPHPTFSGMLTVEVWRAGELMDVVGCVGSASLGLLEATKLLVRANAFADTPDSKNTFVHLEVSRDSFVLSLKPQGEQPHVIMGAVAHTYRQAHGWLAFRNGLRRDELRYNSAFAALCGCVKFMIASEIWP